MRYTYAISAPRHKRARLAGEIESAERAQTKRRGELTALDATPHLFHPDADPAHITSIRPIWRGILLRHGERPRLCLEALRDAGCRQSTAGIAEYVMRAKGMDKGNKELRRIAKKHMRSALGKLVKRGVVRKIMSEPEVWWELAG